MKSIRVCGERLRHYRNAIDMTQVRLAEVSGYSERIIRKAEAGERISRAALEVLADALCQHGQTVTIDDLRETPVNIVRQFIESYDLYYDRMMEHCETLVSLDFEFHSAGDENSPLRGVWKGVDGWQRWLDTMKSIVDRPVRGQLHIAFLTEGDIVAAKYTDYFAAPGQAPQQMWVSLYFHVRGGKICRLDNHYDTALASRIEAHGQHGVKKT